MSAEQISRWSVVLGLVLTTILLRKILLQGRLASPSVDNDPYERDEEILGI